MKRAFMASLVLVASLLAVPTGAHAQVSGSQNFLVIFHNEEPGRVIATGTINAVGTVVDISVDEGPGNTARTHTSFVFPSGRLFLTLSFTFDTTVDPRTCVRTSSLRGTFQVTGGDGAFSDASGDGSLKGGGHGVSLRTVSGCAESEIASVDTAYLSSRAFSAA
jgi:hypothetical protein